MKGPEHKASRELKGHPGELVVIDIGIMLKDKRDEISRKKTGG
jgi:hypothetical protein